jgi:3-deoxy-manno-octulosonate cytidylyltransferase (CMP-KDO synthetase)
VAHGIIPARYSSTRFPGKPLIPLHGKPMFWHVWSRASACPHLTTVTLATDDDRIRDAALDLHVPVVMTGTCHQSGTDRVYEAATLLRLPQDAVIVNIQGDEPALDPRALTDLLGAFADPAVSAATLVHPLDPGDLDRPDKVKVVLTANGDALYFSRAGIPYARDGSRGQYAAPLGHIGIYAFTLGTLRRFVGLPPSPLERTEKLEQLRLLENGIPLRAVRTAYSSPGVDHEEDVARVLPLLSAC